VESCRSDPQASDSEHSDQDAKYDDDDADDVNDVEDDDDDDDQPSSRAFRSTYIGRGNVKAVRSARKLAGLNDSFPKSDPLLLKFAEHMRLAGKAPKDINNKVNSNIMKDC